MPLATLLIGGSLALSRFDKHHFAATALSGCRRQATFALLTYAAGINTLYGTVKSPALPTAVGHLCVASAIVLRTGMMPALPQVAIVVAAPDRARMHDRRPAPDARRKHWISHHRCAAQSGA
jgi:hypothetical protein